MISNELHLLLLASNRHLWCSFGGRTKHLLPLSHRCWSSGRSELQLARQCRSPIPRPLTAASSAHLWHCEPLGTGPAAVHLHKSREPPISLVLMSVAQPPPEQQQQQQQKQQHDQRKSNESRRARQDQKDKEAIESLKKELKQLQSRRSLKYNNPCKVSPNYTKTCTIDELNAVKYHLEELIPRFFVSIMDYSLFTPDVVYINALRNPPTVSRGVYRLSVDRLKLKIFYDVYYAMKKLQILRIDTDTENCCMAVHARVRCLGGLKPFTNLVQMSRFGFANYVEKKSEWHDYLIHFHVTNDARVWQVRVTNLTEDRSPDAAARRPSLLQRVRQLLRRRTPLPAAA